MSTSTEPTTAVPTSPTDATADPAPHAGGWAATTRPAHHWTPEWHVALDEILAGLPTRPLAEQIATRRALAKDPLAFAIIYFPHHLKDAADRMTFSRIHYEWAAIGLTWDETSPYRPQPDEHTGLVQNRHAIIGPRESGKSTWNFLLLPMWAGANGHSKFAAAFAASSTQAEAHLLTMRNEMDQNSLLQLDFPDMCRPARRRSGTSVSDRGGMIHMQSGFVFAAKGMDSGLLGMKIGALRPDLLIFDDIEPDEANYSADLAMKRLGTLLDACFPLNFKANVMIVGTVTMPGSITHQIVKAAKGVTVEDWIRDEKILCHYYPAIITNEETLEEESIWPGKWPLAWLRSIRHTRSYAKNYDNDPMARDGVYWVRDDFVYADLDGCTKTALFVDPAVTTKKTSDFSGIAVISYRPADVVPIPLASGGFRYRTVRPSQVVIRYSAALKLTGQHLRKYIEDVILPKFPKIRMVFVESNQGGDLWADTFANLPGVRVVQHNSSTSKEIRFGEALHYWQMKRVYHARRWDVLEEQAVGFPKAAYDDVVDAAVSGVRYFLMPDDRPDVGAIETSTI